MSRYETEGAAVTKEGFTVRAEELDAHDPLASFRDQFVVGDGLIYLDGNSLVRLPKAAIYATRIRVAA